MGSIFRQKTTRTDPTTGEKITTESKKYYIQYSIAPGKVRREPAFTDKRSSLERLAERERDIARGIVGLPSLSPIDEHIKAFGLHLKNRGRRKSYYQQTETRVRDICTLGGIELVTDLVESRVDAGLTAIAQREAAVNARTADTPTADSPATKKGRRRGFSPATRNHYLRAVKMFSRWLRKNNRSGNDAIRVVYKPIKRICRHKILGCGGGVEY